MITLSSSLRVVSSMVSPMHVSSSKIYIGPPSRATSKVFLKRTTISGFLAFTSGQRRE